MAKIIKKKVKFKVVPFLILCVVLILLYFIVNFSLELKIKNIFIYDNKILSDQEIIELAELEDYPSFFKTIPSKVEKKIKFNSIIKDVSIKRGFFNVLNIYIKEYKILFIKKTNNKLVLENASEIDLISDVSAPTLLNEVDNSIYSKFISEMTNINEEVKDKISEIKYIPSEYDKTRFLLYMKDGNFVYININKFNNLNYYNEIYPTLNNKKGTLYLDSGNHFEVFK